MPGTAVTYTIVVTNAGPSNVIGATVADPFPGSLTGVTWTATCTGRAIGFTASGSGNINDTVNMPAGGTHHLHGPRHGQRRGHRHAGQHGHRRRRRPA